MGYVKIRIKDVGTPNDLHLWQEHMQETPKCWNKFCLGCYKASELNAVHVLKEGKCHNTYITTLCEDCVKKRGNYDILVNEKHLMVETQALYKKENNK